VSSEPGTDEGLRFLLVEAGEVMCAMPLDRLRRVLRVHPVHPLPGSSKELLGLAELSGEPVPVLDLALLVGSSVGAGATPPVTVVAWVGPHSARQQVGFGADAALDIVTLGPPETASETSALVRGEVLCDGRPVAILDLETLGGRV
jgi:chemotaxis signal transduction protein